MSPSFELYQPGDSALHRLDPRVKFILTLGLILVALTQSSALALAVLLLIVLGFFVSAKIQMARVRWLWRLIAPTLIMIAVLWILLYPSVSPFLSLWILKLGWDNLAQALSILLRLTVIALGTFLWLFTTNQAELVLSLVYLGLPYEFGLMLSIAFEQIPGLSRTFATVKQSYMARALDPDKGSLFKRIHATYPILIATIISSLRRADELSHVMQARAMGASSRRTHLHTLTLTSPDKWWLVTGLILTAALLAARWGWGLGQGALWPFG